MMERITTILGAGAVLDFDFQPDEIVPRTDIITEEVDKILIKDFMDGQRKPLVKFVHQALKDAAINHGIVEEQELVVSKDRFMEGIQRMIKETAFKRIQNEKELADALWQKVGLPGVGMPDVIFKIFMDRMYSEESKQGDRKSAERYVEVFNETLQSFGFQPL